MRDSLQAIDRFLAQRNVKRAEILIAKLLRTEQPPALHAQLLYRRARTRLHNGRPEAALEDLQKFVSLLSDQYESPAVRELFADCYFARFELAVVGFSERNDAVQAQQHYQWIIDTHPQYDNLGWVYYQLGRVLLTDDNLTEAVHCFERALLLPGQSRALTAYCYERLGFVAFYGDRDFNRALMFLTKAIDTYPQGEDRAWLVQVYLLRSRVYREMHQRDQAISSANTALKLASSSRTELKAVYAEALVANAELLADVRGREREVVAYLEQFRLMSRRPVGIDVTWARIHEILGDAYMVLGDYTDAVIAYLAVLQFNPNHPWEASIYYRIGKAYYHQRQYERTIDAVQHALNASENDDSSVDYHIYDLLGNAHFALSQYDKAAEAYAAALRLAPSHQGNLEKTRHYYHITLELLGQ